MAVRAMRVFLFFFLLLGGFVCAFLRERGFPFGRGGLRCAVMVGRVLGKRGSGFCAVSDGKIRRQSPAGRLVVAFLFCSIIFRFVPVGVLRLSGRTLPSGRSIGSVRDICSRSLWPIVRERRQGS